MEPSIFLCHCKFTFDSYLPNQTLTISATIPLSRFDHALICGNGAN